VFFFLPLIKVRLYIHTEAISESLTTALTIESVLPLLLSLTKLHVICSRGYYAFILVKLDRRCKLPQMCKPTFCRLIRIIPQPDTINLHLPKEFASLPLYQIGSFIIPTDTAINDITQSQSSMNSFLKFIYDRN
jgi:hypothetical protein